MIDIVFEGSKPSLNNFQPIRNNRGWSKPEGGLWTSPMMKNNVSAWRSWCEQQKIPCANQRWHIIMSDTCRTLSVEKDLGNVRPYLTKTNLAGLQYVIDFEKLAKDFDMLYVSNEVIKQHKNGVFAGFDVPTGLFLNMADKDTGKPLFRGLDDREFENFKAQRNYQGDIGQVDEISSEAIDLENDPVLQRFGEALYGEHGEEEQMRAVLSLLSVFGKSR